MEQNFKRTYLDPEDLTPAADDSGYKYALLKSYNMSGYNWEHPSFVDPNGVLPEPVSNVRSVSISQGVDPLFTINPIHT